MSMSKPNVLVFGLGGIGGVYACLLSLSERCCVHVVARSNYESVKTRGFRLVSPKLGDHDDIQFAGVWRSCREANESNVQFDYVICANKALLDAEPSLSEHLRPVITSTTSIVLLQNGVGIEAPLHESFPNTTIISAVVWTGGKMLPEKNGIAGVEHFSDLSLTIGVDYRANGDKAEEDAKLDRFVEMIKAGKGGCIVTDDIQSQRWVKVIWNAYVNSLTAAIRLPSHFLFAATPFAEQLSMAILSETSTVARAKGLNIPPETEQQLFDRCKAGIPGAKGYPSSMMMDCIDCKPMEVEAILGTPLREGQRLGIPTPTLLTMYTILKAVDLGRASPDL
ncbi:ketopantoate reductase PanE/ApbA C terminal-domain-containing protein [Kockovaella imperatae]|uniref:2-dehydropantoate 2-reductase n=1 Tax=Kockovaella imperatae TaxID=4999 RepID=A0A1Y1UFE5_9TREE|nr:ketopantoate reductase PanE/ApbA C terminal-domain-containing protein [Kockovaella imperatae]ORX36226.1 ketopantoate reductase PanE/ApbA C terminal-domain-containing protein [Kockovaella imperatae]